VKRTLVERVAVACWEISNGMRCEGAIPTEWHVSEARRLIAMVRRHDARKAGKR